MAPRIHPGELLLEELLERGFIPNDFAEQHQIDSELILAICKGETAISVDLADKLAESLGTSTDLWLNLQKAYEDSKMPADIGRA